MSEVHLKQLEVMHPVASAVGELCVQVVTQLSVDGVAIQSSYLEAAYEKMAIGETGRRLFLPTHQARNLKTFYTNVFSEGAAERPRDCHDAVTAIMGWDQIVKDDSSQSKTAPINPEAVPITDLDSGRPYRIGNQNEGRIRVLHSVLAVGGTTLSVLGIGGPLVTADPEELLQTYEGTAYFRALPPKRALPLEPNV